MSEREMGLGRVFLQEAIKAGTWGIIFLLIVGIFITIIKQDIKEGIAYAVDRIVFQVEREATDPYLIGKAKQLIKEGIEYSLTKTSIEVNKILAQNPIQFTIKTEEMTEEHQTEPRTTRE